MGKNNKKYTYEEVKDTVECLGYELICTEYNGAHCNLTIKDMEGFYYNPTFNNLRRKKPMKFYVGNVFTIKNINLQLKINNSNLKVISDKYTGNKNKLIVEDNYGYRGTTSLVCLLSSETIEKFSLTNPYILNNIELWLKINNFEYILLNKEFKKDDRLYLRDKDGFLYMPTFAHLRQGNIPRIVDKKNLFSIYNIKQWCKLYNKPFRLISKRYEGNHKKLNWKCLDENCGQEFESSWSAIFKGIGCHFCADSKGEKNILIYFKDNYINNEVQKTFSNLHGMGNGLLSYDFYLPNHNLLIEYQGIQHEKPVDFLGFGEKYAKRLFQKQQEHDRRKREYAKLHNIKLLEIWYWDFDNIEEILSKELKLTDNISA